MQATLAGTDPQAINVAVPANFVVMGVIAFTTEAFAGGGVSSLSLDVTVGGGPVITGYNLMAAVGDTNMAFNDNGTGLFAALSKAAYNLVFTVTPDGGANMTGLTAGSLTYYIVGIQYSA